MRVAIVQEHIDTARGGAETSTLEMAGLLAELGVQVTVLSASRGKRTRPRPAAGEDRDAPRAAGCEYAALRIEEIDVGDRLTRLGRTRAFIARAEKRCRTAGFDLVHAITPCLSAHVYQPRGGTYVETIVRSLAVWRTPFARALRGLGRRFNARQQFLLKLERALLNRSPPPVVAAVSRYVARQVRQAAPRLAPEQVRVVFNAVNLRPVPDEPAARRAVRGALGFADEAALLLFVAHNFRLKGLATLLEALAAGTARGHAWRLVIVGRDRPEPYRRMARRLGLRAELRLGSLHPAGELRGDPPGALSHAQVIFLGPRGDLARFYAAADVLVHPTWYDPASRVVLEALCCGLPVVTTVFNGAAEVVEPGRTGEVLEDPADAAGLCAAIERAARPPIRQACRAAAPAMRERLSMSRHASELLALYRSLRT
jgi:UDP-glucose:(heptosyl)LPS alpha-1,3-glucosyltransferase